LDDAVRWMKKLGVRHVRTGISWADSFRPGAWEWFDKQMSAREDFDTTVTFCFTPEHRSLALDHGLPGHHTSPPQLVEEFADFCAQVVRRYAPGHFSHQRKAMASFA
jgi:beta-xylosidase